MPPEMERFREVFRAEATELLAGMEGGLIALEGAFDKAALDEVFRAVHTLKGNAALLGFAAAAQLAHAAEDLLEKLAAGALQLSPELSTLLLRAVDALRLLLDVPRGGGEAREVDPAEITRKLGEAARTDAREPARAASAGDAEAERPAEPTARKEQERSLRVPLGRLDRMLDLMGEIAIARGQLGAMIAAAERTSFADLAEVHEKADRLHVDLQQLLLEARMVPIGRAFRPFARTLRDLSATTGKLVRLETSGEEVEVDASIVDLIRDPLTHLVRNAVDHGIERPEVRRARGKTAVGVLALAARREGGSIVVEVADDGAGLDKDRIRARARALGLLGEGEERDGASLFQFVFERGFSTAERVTELSGRGIGMDVVKRNIEALRGSVSLETTAGQGTLVRLRLPLSLSILDGFSVRVGPDTYVLPLESVVECVELPAHERGAGSTGIASLRGRPLPYLRLRNHFGVAGAPPPRESIEHDGREAGLVVDALLGQGQTIIKPLGRLFQRIPGISGSAILGTGRVALILDAATLLGSFLDAPAPA